MAKKISEIVKEISTERVDCDEQKFWTGDGKNAYTGGTVRYDGNGKVTELYVSIQKKVEEKR